MALPKISSPKAAEYGLSPSFLDQTMPLNRSNTDKSAIAKARVQFLQEEKLLPQDSMTESSRRYSIDLNDRSNNEGSPVSGKGMYILSKYTPKVKSDLKLNLSIIGKDTNPLLDSPFKTVPYATLKKRIRSKKLTTSNTNEVTLLSNDILSSFDANYSTVDTSKFNYQSSAKYEMNEKSMYYEKYFHENGNREHKYWKNYLLKADTEVDEHYLTNISDRISKHQRHIERVDEKIVPIESAEEVMFFSNKKKNLPPRKFGFVSKSDDKTVKVKLGHYKLRDNFAEIISNGLKFLPKIDSVELKNNALSPKGAKFIFPALTPNLKILDLSLNKLGESGAMMLVEHFNKGNSLIEHLNLESNEIGDKAATQLINIISENLYLKKLNLSKNNISNQSCAALSKYLAYPSTTLLELYLHYNKIQGDGAKSIFNALTVNSNLKVLDLSWNTIGHQDNNLGLAFQNLFIKNNTLVHCDFSYNSISYQQTSKAAEGLAKNNTIIGIHWFGNQGYIRSDGHLIPKNESGFDEVPNLAISKFRINGIKACIGESLKHSKYVSSENCWICGAWEQKTFSYTPGRSGKIFNGPIYIHFSYENYVPKELTQNEEGQFSITLIVPPGIIYYFFTSNNEPFVAQDTFLIRNYPPDIKNVKIGKNKFNFQLDRLNSTKHEQKPVIQSLVTDDYVLSVNYLPRMNKLAPNEISAGWNRKNSVFRNVPAESEVIYFIICNSKEFLDSCFDFDWNATRLTRIANDEIEIKKLYDLLKSMYRVIKDTYKHYSAFDPLENVFCITEKSLPLLIHATSVLEGDKVSMEEIISNISAIGHYSTKNPLDPDNALVRHQLMEVIVRIGLDKYMKNKVGVKLIQAVQKTLNNDFSKVFKSINIQEWREKVLWTQNCDIIFKSYMSVVKDSFRKHCQYSNTSQKKDEHPRDKINDLENCYMCLEDFRAFCKDLDLSQEDLPDHEINLAYNYSMWLQIDEINQDRHLKMNSNEFIEAFARIADVASLQPYTPEDKIDNRQTRLKMPLHIKIEGLCERAHQRCLTTQDKITFLLPETPISSFLKV